MSSTNRTKRTGDLDVFETPPWCVRRLLDVWIPPIGTLVEPCAGDRHIVNAINRYWITYDIRELPGIDFVVDFLGVTKRSEEVAAVVTNPPYCLAEKFIRHSRFLCPRAELIFLLRIAFLASEQRLRLWRDLGTPNIYVLPNRPSFTGKGTDSADYAWFHWPVEKRDHGDIRVLANTMKSERFHDSKG